MKVKNIRIEIFQILEYIEERKRLDSEMLRRFNELIKLLPNKKEQLELIDFLNKIRFSLKI